jgi:hypothetical protein
MRLTEAQLRHIVRVATQSPRRRMGSEHDQAVTAARHTDNASAQKISEVMRATEEVIRAADNVIRAAHNVSPVTGPEPIIAVADLQDASSEPDRIALPVPIEQLPQPHRPTSTLTIGFAVLLPVVIVASSVLLTYGRRSAKTEAPNSTLVLSQMADTQAGAGPSGGGATALPTNRSAPPSTASGAPGLRADDARLAAVGARREAAANEGSGGVNAVSPRVAPGLLTPAQTMPRAGTFAPGSAADARSSADGTLQPQSRPVDAGSASPRVAALGEPGAAAPASLQPSGSRRDGPADGAPRDLSAPTASDGLAACLAARPPPLRLRQDETGELFRRGEEYFGQGRISAARLLFRRAAEACDMKAAFALGATYDPIMLKKLGVMLLDPNIDTARAWYEQARRLGLSEASHQLELLSRMRH